MKHSASSLLRYGLTAFALLTAASSPGAQTAPGKLADDFANVRPVLEKYCYDCHNAEKQKGDLDLKRFQSVAEIITEPKPWEGVIEQMHLGEMPPKEKPQPDAAEREKLLAWVKAVLDEAARARAGDPGPVVLRRLNNVEFNYTVRDLTGVDSLEPAKEFPADSAAGEGFMNTGGSLVMSPPLLTKYLDAAKDIAAHAVLLPDGIRFSASVSQRDWTEERLAAIRGFYSRYTVNGGGSAVNLQGIQFDTKDGGVLPLDQYLAATLTDRESLKSGMKTLQDVARERQLNAKYLGLLWDALNNGKSSVLLDAIRIQWQAAKPGGEAAVLALVQQWQQALWRFTQVGHIGKRDGPKGWQVPVTPLAGAREVRVKLTPAPGAAELGLYLAVSDAGDGYADDFAVWENARLTAPGRKDLPLQEVRAAVNAVSTHRRKVFSTTAKCLNVAAEVTGSPDREAIGQLAARHGVDPEVLAAWLDCLGIGPGETKIDGYLTQMSEKAESFDFIKGWMGADALSVSANASDQHVRVPGNVKPHGVVVHPSPKQRVLVSWRSPAAAVVQVEGSVQHAHPECGNGVTWALELRRGTTRQRLAAGVSQGGEVIKFGPLEKLAVQPRDLLSMVIGPQDGNHSCDLTSVEFTLTDGSRTWDLAKDVSPDILAGNPHADRMGNAGIWHFHSEPDNTAGQEPVVPSGSLLSKWQTTTEAAARQALSEQLQHLLLTGPENLPADAPDAVLFRQMTSLHGPLLGPLLRSSNLRDAPATGDMGLDPALFGKHPTSGAPVDAADLCVQAPSVIEVRLPADFAEGCEFVVTARLHKDSMADGSVQMQVLTTKPSGAPGLTAGSAKEQSSKSTWSDGERPVVSDSPIIVSDNAGSPARRRIIAGFDAFRELFPAALCYTKIVPVDEVVTLTLYYREDDHLKRLMLDDAQSAELDRRWDEMHYVSEDALKLVDAYDQLWQFATQDADPSAFTPMREPIRQQAAEFRKRLEDTQPAHLEAVLHFAQRAWRRPLTDSEKEKLRALYRRLLSEELPHGEAIRLTLARVFVAPAFLYRKETAAPGKGQAPVNDWELATRLSYFLWSSAPDPELLRTASEGRLHDPEVLAVQARRMLQDPRVRRMATEFGCVWLHVHGFDSLNEKSERHFPDFTALRGAMYEESIQVLTDLFLNNRSAVSLLDADYTWLNEALAAYYGVPGVKGAEWRKVDGVRAFGRGGVLGQAAILAKQSGASRTSPILRGNWLCDTLLGDKLPRPPKGVPTLPEEAPQGLTERQMIEKHSSDAQCAGCHVRIDPYGYSLEAYDAVGRLRSRDAAGLAINTRVSFPNGTTFDGMNGLRDYLLTKRRGEFIAQFYRKLLGYALGRSVLLSDKPLLDEMMAKLEAGGHSTAAAVEMIVRSRQFREIRGIDHDK